MASIALPEESDYVPQQIDFAVRGLTNYLPKDAVKKNFGALKTDTERYKYVAGIKEVDDVICFEKEFLDKNADESEKAREEGNKFFKEKSYLTAAQSYSKSIVYAPQTTKRGLALAYANRSAAWFHLKRYRLCLADIQLALAHEYPTELEYKLFDRQGKCFTIQGKKDDAKNSFLKAQSSLDVAKLDNKKLTEWQANLKKELEKCGKITVTPKQSEQTTGKKIEIKEHNPTWDKFSSAVEIHHQNDVGRHVIAEKDIKIGEVVLTEKPYASVLLSEHYYNHCYHCYSRPWAPVPCPTCASVIYCSDACQQQSWALYHIYECSFQAFLNNFWCGRIGHLALRIVMTTGLPKILEVVEESKDSPDEPDSINVAVKDGKYGNTFQAIYRLSAKTKTRTPEGLFDYSVFSYFLMKLLEKTGWLQATQSEKEIVGGAIVRLLQILQNNSQGILELLQPGDVETPYPAHVGIGLYCSAALVNHSCYASADFTFHGDQLVLRAMREIYKGEEVNVEYLGLSALYMERKKRTVVLRANFGFVCECTACKEQYPEWKSLDAELPWFHCVECRADLDVSNFKDDDGKKYVKCAKCEHKQDLGIAVEALQTSHENFAKGMDLLLNGKSEDALPLLVGHHRVMQRYIGMPWRDLAACQGAIRQCYRLTANIRMSFLDCV